MPIYRYFQETTTLSLLPEKDTEEVLLVKQIKNGDRKALETLTIANLHFVVCVAKRFQNQGLTLHDLIMKGNRGLTKAAERFDKTRGFEFISYAVWCIRQSIIEAIAENLRIKPIPLNKIGLISKGNNSFTKGKPYFQREPGNEEIAGMLEFHRNIVKDATQAQKNKKYTMSL